MARYILLEGSRRGLRVADAATEETVVLMGRVLDNMSELSARDIIVLLERRERLHREHLDAAAARNDLGRLFEEMQGRGA